MSNVSDAIRKGRILIAAAYAEDQVVEKLVAEGVPRSLAERVAAFIPLACGRALLAGTGVALADTYLVSRNGEMVERPLAGEEVYRRVYADAVNGRIPKPIFNVCAMRSSELDAVNQALNAGAAIENLVAGPPVLLRITDDAELPKTRWWWPF